MCLNSLERQRNDLETLSEIVYLWFLCICLPSYLQTVWCCRRRRASHLSVYCSSNCLILFQALDEKYDSLPCISLLKCLEVCLKAVKYAILVLGVCKTPASYTGDRPLCCGEVSQTVAFCAISDWEQVHVPSVHMLPLKGAYRPVSFLV